MSKWMPIESAPKDGTWILGWQGRHDGANKPANVVRWVPHYGWSLWSVEDLRDPTHWQPLPSPPNEAQTR